MSKGHVLKSRQTEDIINNVADAILQFGTCLSKTQYDEWDGRIASSRGINNHIVWTRMKELAINRLGATDRNINQAPDDKKLDWKGWLDFAVKTKDTLVTEGDFTCQQVAEWGVKTGPVAIVFSSDWHLGSIATNYKVFKQNIEYLIETKDLYMVVVGDTIDNFLQFPDKSAVLAQVLNPLYQKKMLKSIIDELIGNGKIIATGWGDHDSRFEEKLSGSDVIRTLTANRIPYFPGKGVLKMTVGKQDYTCSVTHKSRFNSYINETHGSSQEYRTFIPADICVTGHLHSPAFSVCHRLPIAREAGMKCGGQVILIRTGSYKQTDIYSMRFWNAGVIGTPTVVMYGDQWKLMPFATAEDAVSYMRACK